MVFFFEVRVGWGVLLSLTRIEQPHSSKSGSIIRWYSGLKTKVRGVLSHNFQYLDRGIYTLKWSWGESSHHRHFEVIHSLQHLWWTGRECMMERFKMRA